MIQMFTKMIIQGACSFIGNIEILLMPAPFEQDLFTGSSTTTPRVHGPFEKNNAKHRLVSVV